MSFSELQNLLSSVHEQRRQNLALLELIDGLLDRLLSVQVQLRQTLDQVLDDLPPHRDSLSTAKSRLISANAEYSLVEMSLLHTRAHRFLYGTDITTAVGFAFRNLKANEARARDQERALDRKLAEYYNLLAVIDGNDIGGFQQIVHDWTAVQRETEECRRDLRRLGWTGD